MLSLAASAWVHNLQQHPLVFQHLQRTGLAFVALSSGEHIVKYRGYGACLMLRWLYVNTTHTHTLSLSLSLSLNNAI